MHIDLRFEIACTADSAWVAVHTTAVAAELYGSIMRLRPLTAMPEQFRTGDEVEVELRFAGIVPVGRQVIRITDEVHGKGDSLVRTMHDTGYPVRGPLALVRGWHHRMTITEAPGRPGHAIWRDRLSFTGPFAMLAWPVLWITWVWRARHIRRLAPGWPPRSKSSISATSVP